MALARFSPAGWAVPANTRGNARASTRWRCQESRSSRACRVWSTRSLDSNTSTSTSSYEWRGFKLAYTSTPASRPPTDATRTPALVLVHGFGSSKNHFRKMLAPFAFEGADVYALDLLGFGESEKPTTTAYNMRLYRDQIIHFIETQVPKGAPVHLVGNSIGSLASLMVGASDEPTNLASIILLNCAGGLNNKGAAKEWFTKIVLPIFWLIDLVLWSSYGPKLFDNVRSETNLRQVLTNLYPSNPDAVDDDLVRQFVQSAEDPNAFHVFREIYTTSDAGPYPLDLLDDISCPIHVMWGSKDGLTPSMGPVGRGLRAKAASFVEVPGAGHVFFDERPDETILEINKWIAKF